MTDEEFNSILKSHMVNPDFMYRDDFNGFFTDRKEKILQKIEAVMGKNIAREQEMTEEGFFVDEGEGNSDSDYLIPNQ